MCDLYELYDRLMDLNFNEWTDEDREMLAICSRIARDCNPDKREFLEKLLSDLWKAYEMFKGQEEHDAYTRTLVLEACSMLSKTFLETTKT